MLYIDCVIKEILLNLLKIWIKELKHNKNKTFSFNKEETEELNDDFYSPLKSKIIPNGVNDIKFDIKYNGKKKINIFMKKNSSFNDFNKYSKWKKCVLNIKNINNILFTHINNNNNGRIMPINQAE